jgi:hypothetical protein
VLDEVAIEIEAQPGVPEDRITALGRELVHHSQGPVRHQHRVKVLEPGSHRPLAGKAVRVRDLRPKEHVNMAKLLHLKVNGRERDRRAAGQAPC